MPPLFFWHCVGTRVSWFVSYPVAAKVPMVCVVWR
jgi:hypothetical protein